MPYSLSLALAACAVVLALTPLVMALARRVGALDRPGPRRVHSDPVPTLGGLSMVAGVLGVAWAARILPGPAVELDPRPLLGLTLAAIPIVALGVRDDLRPVSPGAKLAVQTCAAIVLTVFGYGVPLITNPFGPPIHTGALSGPLAVAWTLVVMNAINLIDGIDGLASGVVLMASGALWLVAHSHADFYVLFITSLLIGATLGFLRYNFPPARVFMGDTGSQFLGLTLAAVALLENRKGTAVVTLLYPLVAMALPIADSLRAFARRLVRGRPVFGADTGHIHHKLLGRGLSPRRALLVLWSLCAAFAAIAVALERLPRRYALLLTALAVAVLFVLELLDLRHRRARDRAATEAPNPQAPGP